MTNARKQEWTPGPWYASSTGNHQGLIISEKSGANIAVTYDAKDAPRIVACVNLLEGLSAQDLENIAGRFPSDPRATLEYLADSLYALARMSA